MPSDGSERRVDMPQVLGELGEIRGTLATFMADYARTSGELREDLKNRVTADAERWARLDEKLMIISAWKEQMTGGMKVATILWRTWAGAVTLVLAVLGYMRLH